MKSLIVGLVSLISTNGFSQTDQVTKIKVTETALLKAGDNDSLFLFAGAVHFDSTVNTHSDDSVRVVISKLEFKDGSFEKKEKRQAILIDSLGLLICAIERHNFLDISYNRSYRQENEYEVLVTLRNKVLKFKLSFPFSVSFASLMDFFVEKYFPELPKIIFDTIGVQEQLLKLHK